MLVTRKPTSFASPVFQTLSSSAFPPTFWKTNWIIRIRPCVKIFVLQLLCNQSSLLKCRNPVKIYCISQTNSPFESFLISLKKGTLIFLYTCIKTNSILRLTHAVSSILYTGIYTVSRSVKCSLCPSPFASPSLISMKYSFNYEYFQSYYIKIDIADE